MSVTAQVTLLAGYTEIGHGMFVTDAGRKLIADHGTISTRDSAS